MNEHTNPEPKPEQATMVTIGADSAAEAFADAAQWLTDNDGLLMAAAYSYEGWVESEGRMPEHVVRLTVVGGPCDPD